MFFGIFLGIIGTIVVQRYSGKLLNWGRKIENKIDKALDN
jgi:F0F1-type ATP synthase membrane subunit b/b'